VLKRIINESGIEEHDLLTNNNRRKLLVAFTSNSITPYPINPPSLMEWRAAVQQHVLEHADAPRWPWFYGRYQSGTNRSI
jgi:hypothetical protein